MPLSAKDPIAKWIDDFKKSDAPQFKGKSGEDRKAMAIAAYMDAKKGAKQEKGWDSEVRQVESIIPEDVHARYMRAHGKKAKGQGRWIFTTSRNSQSQGKEFVHRGDFSAAHKAAQKHFGTKNVYVMESTDAYAKSQAAIRDRKKRAGMTSSDQKKMGAVADMMRREREKRAQQRNEENADECWTGYKKQGMKKKGDKMVPNCVPEELKKVECPKCEGDGCSHCDDKGYHMAEKTNNLVAKHARKYNKAHVMADRKRKAKKGYVKHKGKAFQEEVETDSAARKPVTITDPRTGKKSVRMQPAHRKELDHDHKKGEVEQMYEARGSIRVDIPYYDDEPTRAKKVERKYRVRVVDKGRDYQITGDKKNIIKFLMDKDTLEWDKDEVKYEFPELFEAMSVQQRSARGKVVIKAPESEMSKRMKRGQRNDPVNKIRAKSYPKESMDPRDHTDKPGHLVVVTKPSGKKMIKHYHPTSAGAQKYADRINKTNRVGHKATVHRTDGRRIMEEVSEFLVVKRNPSFSGSSSSSSSSSRSRRGAGSTSSQSVTTTSGNGYKIKRNIKTGKTTKSRYNVGGTAAQKESTKEEVDTGQYGARKKPQSSEKEKQSVFDKHRARVKKLTKEEVDTGQYGARKKPQSSEKEKQSVFDKHRARVKKLNKEETIAEAMSAKLRNKMKELAGGQLPRSSVELRKLKAKAQEELRSAAKAKKAAPKKQSTTKTRTGKKHMGSMEAGDRNIVMQLRKAQDLKGNHDIIVSPKGRTTRLPKAMIDKLLKRFDSLQKPQDKRRFQIMVTKELRKRAK